MEPVSLFLLFTLAIFNYSADQSITQMQEDIAQLEESYVDLAVRHSLLYAGSRTKDEEHDNSIERIEEKLDFIENISN